MARKTQRVLYEHNIWRIPMKPRDRWEARQPWRGGKQKTFGSLKEARGFRDGSSTKRSEGLPTDPKRFDVTLDAIAADFLQVHAETVGPRRAAGVASMWQSQLSSTFGSMRPIDVTKTHVQAFRTQQAKVVRKQKNGTTKRGFSEGTIRNAVVLLGMVFDHAIELHAAHGNPVERSKRKGQKTQTQKGAGRRRAQPLHVMHSIIDLLKTPDQQLAADMALQMGVRAGEARGVTVDRISGVHLTIDRQLLTHPGGHVFDEGQWHEGLTGFGPTKTRKTRILKVPAPLLEAISEHVELYGTGPEGLVLQGAGTAAGRPLHSRALEDAWSDAAQRAGFPGVRFHDLRHTYITQLLDAGVRPEVVAELAGHSSPRVTLDVYAHATEQAIDEAADVAAAFSRSSRTTTAQPRHLRAVG